MSGFGSGGFGAVPFGGSSGNAYTVDVAETLTVSDILTSPADPIPEFIPGVGGWGGNYGWGWGGGYPIGDDSDINITLTLIENLTVGLPFNLEAASSPASTIVRAEFSHPLDFSYAPVLDPANYLISGLIITAVNPAPETNAVLLTVGPPMQPIVYELIVTDARSAGGDPLLNDRDFFGGFGLSPTFIANAQSATKIAVVFTNEMADSSDLTSASNYTVTDLQGNVIPVVSVTAGVSPITRVELELGAPLTPFNYYPITISTAVETVDGRSLVPNRRMIQWTPREFEWLIDTSSFTGEVEGGLLGTPAGQIFFSPALEQAIAESIIEVDEAGVCTRAYDEYTIPQLEDPPPLHIWAPSPFPQTVIGDSLFTTAERQGLARTNVSDLQEDTYTPPTDGPADATLVEVDETRIALLNNPNWVLFDNVSTSFITADTISGPIPPVGTTNINLQH